MVLFFSGYSDRYYKPLPEGRRFGADPLESKSPAWPGPDPDCMEYLAGRKVMTLGIDSTSMGPIPDLAEPTHFAGLKHGMIWTESNIGLGQLPTTGAFYCILGPKYAGGIYSEMPAFAVVGDPLARRLIDSARKRNVVDLSVVLAEDLPVSWPGRGVGNHRQLFITIRRASIPTRERLLKCTCSTATRARTWSRRPTPCRLRLRRQELAPEVQEWLAEYEKKYGRRGTSDMTTEKVPLSQTCGPARVIDVRPLVGSTDQGELAGVAGDHGGDIRKDEKKHGELQAGDIVIFQSGWSDRYCRPLPLGKACMDDPLNGKSEGWPAPGPERSSTWRGRESAASPPTHRHWAASSPSGRS